MKNLLTLLFIFCFTIFSYAQIKFEKGYFIDNSGKRKDCLIKNVEWKNNPKNVKYKLTESSVIKDLKINTIKEFSVDEVKYKRFKLKVDSSKDNLQSMTADRDPVWKEELVFLRVLVQGKASLYFYKDNVKRFFFSTNDIPIQQLIHKYYFMEGIFKVENNDFRKQLETKVNCKNSSAIIFDNINYKKKNLVNYFTKYNLCERIDITYSEKKKAKNKIHFKIKPGLNFQSLTYEETGHLNEKVVIDFENKTTFRFGIELEYIFPYNKNKWGIYIEPSYKSYENKKEVERKRLLPPWTTIQQTIDVSYVILELPIGIRHYLFLNKSSSLFINAAYIFNGKSKVRSYYLGFGYEFNKKVNLEFRHYPNKNFFGKSIYGYSKYNNSSLIVGYQLF